MSAVPRVSCMTCRWWREQAGSAHVMCPRRMDFSFMWGLSACDIWSPVRLGETVERDGVNQFLYWSTGEGVVTVEQARAYIRGLAEVTT